MTVKPSKSINRERKTIPSVLFDVVLVSMFCSEVFGMPAEVGGSA